MVSQVVFGYFTYCVGSDSTSEEADGDDDNEVADGDSAQVRKKRPRTTRYLLFSSPL